MKKFTLLFITFITLFFSCQDDDFNSNDIIINDNNIVTKFKLDVRLENGMLHFDSSEDFYNSLELISNSADKHVSSEVLNKWENDIGFKSMRREYFEIGEAFSLVENDAELNNFLSEYGDNVFDSEGSLKTPLENETLASILDTDGKVFIDNDLHCFLDNKQIIIIGGDLSKFNRALNTLESSEENGIFVFDTNEENLAGPRSCGQQLITDTKYGFDKKLSAKWQIKVTYTKNTEGCCNLFCGGCVITWTTKKLMYAEMKSEKRASGFLGNYWKKHKDQLEFDYVYTLKETAASQLAFSTGHLLNCIKCDKLPETDIISETTVSVSSKPIVDELPFFIELDGLFKNTRLNLVGHKVCYGSNPCDGVNCDTGFHCENGDCVPNNSPNPECNGEGSCPPGEQCIDGQCMPF